MTPKEKNRLEKLIIRSILQGRTGFAEAVQNERGEDHDN